MYKEKNPKRGPEMPVLKESSSEPSLNELSPVKTINYGEIY